MVEQHVTVQVRSRQRVRMHIVSEVLRLSQHARSPLVDAESLIEGGTAGPCAVCGAESVRLGRRTGPGFPSSAAGRRGGSALGDEARYDGAADLVEGREANVRNTVGLLDKVRRAYGHSSETNQSASQQQGTVTPGKCTHARGGKVVERTP